VHSAGESAGRLRDGRGSRRRAGGGDGDQSRLAVVGDNLGGAAASLIGVQRSRGARSHAGGRGPDGRSIATVEIVMATVNTVSHGRAHHGGGGEKSSLHYEKDNISHVKE